MFRPRSAERLTSLGVEPKRIVLLPPAVAVPRAVPSQEDARRTLGLPLGAPIVVCVSRLTGRKRDGRPGKTDGVLELLRAVATLSPSVLCVVVGDGRGRREVEQERARLGLEGRVLLAGSVPHRFVLLYHAASDVFAYPYDLDRPWLAALEAQACSRPVVTMRTGSAEATVEDGRTGLLSRGREEFRSQLAALLFDRARSGSMGAAGREYVARRHSLEVRVGEIEDLLVR